MTFMQPDGVFNFRLVGHRSARYESRLIRVPEKALEVLSKGLVDELLEKVQHLWSPDGVWYFQQANLMVLYSVLVVSRACQNSEAILVV